MGSDGATQARRIIHEAAPELTALSEAIHASAELGFQEHDSMKRCVDLLKARGFTITTPLCGLDTAFDAVFGSGDLHVAFLAEYDALPDVGHACGHNLIAAASLGAGLGLASLADALGVTVHVMGTPAEEGGAGKVLILDRGGFDPIHAALMVHPWSFDQLESACLAVAHFDVTFTGRTAHASAAPWEGRNAGDAMTIAQVAVGLLRQQLPAGDQVHGVVTDGGQAANIIPSKVTARYMCRSVSAERLEALLPRVRACFEAGALASACEVSIEELGPRYTHMEQDAVLLALYAKHAKAQGRNFAREESGEALPTYSTDMANISLALPAIHPLIDVVSNGAVNHQPEFTAACLGANAERALLDGACALASVAADAASDPAIRARLLQR